MSEQKDKLIEKLKQAVKDTRDCKDIDLPEELYEVFCSIQNQAIGDARRESRGQALIEAGELCRSYIEEAKKQEGERIEGVIQSFYLPICGNDYDGVVNGTIRRIRQALKEEK